MNCNTLVLNYINNCKRDEPIFIEDIKNHIMQFYKEAEKVKVFNNIKTILNRLVKDNIIKTAYKGVYYIPEVNVFGEMPLSKQKIVQYRYLVDKNGNIKGFYTGAVLFNQVGLTTQVPNIKDIATNECKNYNKYTNEHLNVTIRKPKLEITTENYKYLQLFDLIENKDNINIEVKNEDEIIYRIIKENKLDFEKIIKYARETNSRKVLEKILKIAR